MLYWRQVTQVTHDFVVVNTRAAQARDGIHPVL